MCWCRTWFRRRNTIERSSSVYRFQTLKPRSIISQGLVHQKQCTWLVFIWGSWSGSSFWSMVRGTKWAMCRILFNVSIYVHIKAVELEPITSYLQARHVFYHSMDGPHSSMQRISLHMKYIIIIWVNRRLLACWCYCLYVCMCVPYRKKMQWEWRY